MDMFTTSNARRGNRTKEYQGNGGEKKTKTNPRLRTGRHNPTLRRRHKSTPIPLRPRRRHRALPLQGDQAHVKEEDGEAQQDQAFHQDRQLQPPHAHPLHPRARRAEGCYFERYFQGGVAAGRGQEDCQEGP